MLSLHSLSFHLPAKQNWIKLLLQSNASSPKSYTTRAMYTYSVCQTHVYTAPGGSFSNGQSVSPHKDIFKIWRVFFRSHLQTSCVQSSNKTSDSVHIKRTKNSEFYEIIRTKLPFPCDGRGSHHKLPVNRTVEQIRARCRWCMSSALPFVIRQLNPSC